MSLTFFLAGRIVNMNAFLALMNHIHNLCSPTLHTPIMVVSQAAWTAQDLECITQFFFEKFKTPALTIVDASLCVENAFNTQHCTVIDVGYQKTDITAVVDFTPVTMGRTIALKDAGGDTMTKTLLKLLGPKGWTEDMCEQLKKSPYCEILSADTPLPGSGTEKADDISNPAAAASTGAHSSGPNVKITETPKGVENGAGDVEDETEKVVDEEGVLDVASIVASGKTQEFLAAQERKKQAAASRKAAKDAKDAAEASAKPSRIANSKREKVTFHYQVRLTGEEAEKLAQEATKGGDDAPTANADASAEKPLDTTTTSIENGDAPSVEAPPAAKDKDAKPSEDAAPLPEDDEAKLAEPAANSTHNDVSVPVDDAAAKKEQARAAKREEKRKAREGAGDPTLSRREIEVGTERFQACSDGLLERIADAVHRTILSSPDVARRPDLWDNLVIVGNGSKVRGFKEALVETLHKRYLISPSSATMFMSELPSNLSTPIGTGAQTPQREYPPGQHALPTGSSVNPLLLAATTASNPALNPSMSISSQFGGHNSSHSHSGHSQSPTSIKVAQPMGYFPEWKNEGFEESIFLGAQVLAKSVFITNGGDTGYYISRQQYNDMGPSGIHNVGMTY
jgi:actin-related protein 9